MRWNTILFDLDGTVTDPKEGITRAAAYALRCAGRGEADPDSLTDFIGPPLHLIFPKHCGLNEEETDQAIRDFRVYYVERGWRENVPYAGMAEFLDALCKAGKKLIIATSKPEDTARKILDYFDLSRYFTFICGARAGDKASSDKASVIQNALSRAGETGSVIMVGDRSYDVVGAHALSLQAVGVLYGYGSREELTAAGADYLAANLEELKKILLQE